jgi:hypothetical protein
VLLLVHPSQQTLHTMRVFFFTLRLNGWIWCKLPRISDTLKAHSSDSEIARARGSAGRPHQLRFSQSCVELVGFLLCIYTRRARQEQPCIDCVRPRHAEGRSLDSRPIVLGIEHVDHLVAYQTDTVVPARAKSAHETCLLVVLVTDSATGFQGLHTCTRGFIAQDAMLPD